MKQQWDINCDLGEGEPASRTDVLMRGITSANVACGGHAGNLDSMRRCVRLAARHGVRLGAHPGPWDRVNFGRGLVRITPDELELLLLQQVGALASLASEEGVPLHHVKLHGGLYHAVEASPRLARAYLEILGRRWPGCLAYAKAGGKVAVAAAGLQGHRVWGEAFIDRGYLPNGGLVPRGQTGALIESRSELEARLGDLCLRRQVTATSGKRISMAAHTLCIHGDTPAAIRLLFWTLEWMEGQGIGLL